MLGPKINTKRVSSFPAPQSTLFSDHVYHAIHHKLTTKNHHENTHFRKKPSKNQYYRVPAFFSATDFFPETFFAALAGTALFFATFLAADFTATAFLTGVLVTAFAATDFFGVFAREAVMRALTSALRSVTLMVVAVLRRRSRP